MARAAAGAIMLTCAALVAPLPGAAQSAAPAGSSNSVPILSATTLQTLPAPDADQGVAVDADHYYAIDNHVIAKHRRKDGEQVDRWDGGQDGPMQHINSCTIADQLLVCANSNYSALPMGSSVEWFDTTSLRHVASHSLGLRDEGSLVWALPRQSGWIAGFAHYDRADGRGGTGFKNSSYGNVVTFDSEWRRTGGWLLPPTIQERMAPHSASGGDIGPDGLLYLSGHDRGEIYVAARPIAGPYLIHVATIMVETNGQAFAFVPGSDRQIMTVDRRAGLVRLIALPQVALPQGGTAF